MVKLDNSSCVKVPKRSSIPGFSKYILSRRHFYANWNHLSDWPENEADNSSGRSDPLMSFIKSSFVDKYERQLHLSLINSISELDLNYVDRTGLAKVESCFWDFELFLEWNSIQWHWRHLYLQISANYFYSSKNSFSSKNNDFQNEISNKFI